MKRTEVLPAVILALALVGAPATALAQSAPDAVIDAKLLPFEAACFDKRQDDVAACLRKQMDDRTPAACKTSTFTTTFDCARALCPPETWSRDIKACLRLGIDARQRAFAGTPFRVADRSAYEKCFLKQGDFSALKACFDANDAGGNPTCSALVDRPAAFKECLAQRCGASVAPDCIWTAGLGAMVAKELPSIPSCSEFSRRVGVTGTMEEYLLRHLSSTSGAGKTFSGMNKAFAQCYASNITTTLCSFFDGIAGGANAPSTFLTAVMKRADGCAPGTAITCGASKLLDEGWAAMRRAWHFFGDFNPTDPIQVGTMCAVTLGASNFLLMGGTELIGAVASKAKDVARKLVTWARANIFASGQGYTANALIEAARALEGMETPVFARMRPTNPEAVRLLEEGALPKGQQFKSKTAKPIDLALGIEMGDEGKVVYFTPDPKGLGFKAWWKKRPAYIRSKFSNQMEAVEKAFNERIAEFAEQKKAMDALVNKGEIRIEKGVIYDTKTGKFHTGDNDIYDFVDAKGVRITDPKVIAEAQRRIARVLNVEHGGQKYWDMSQLTGEDLAKAQKIADRIELKHHRTEKLIVIGPGGKVRMTFDTDPLPADQIQRLQSYGEPALFQITD